MISIKKTFLLILFLILGSICNAQEFSLQIIGNSKKETTIIDSLNYQSKHVNLNSIQQEVDIALKKISTLGYIDVKLLFSNKVNDSTFLSKITLGKQIKKIRITIKDLETLELLRLKKNTLEIPYPAIESFLEQTLHLLEEKGYSFAKVKLNSINREQYQLSAELEVQKNSIRKINTIVIKQSEKNKFPKGHLTQINRKYKNTLFNLKSLEQIRRDFEKFTFVNQLKYPELLATKDTTRVYVYLERKNSNTFDGFIGFNNNETRFTLNGYLDIQLENILAKGEQIHVFWKSDGNDQKTFNASFELPYLFNSPIGMQTELQIFRQDTTFQNTKTTVGLHYILKNNSKIKLGYRTTQSSVIQNNNMSIEGFNSTFITLGYENNNVILVKNKFRTSLSNITTIGSGKRLITIDTNTPGKQFQIDLKNKLLFKINNKHSLYIDNQNHYLLSDEYVENELYRFGGFNSIRGFRENSIAAYLLTTFLTEYHYALTPKLYVHSILDLAYFETSLNNFPKKNNLTGLGFGIGVQTNNGLLRIAVANGTVNAQNIKTENTILHLSYSIKF